MFIITTLETNLFHPLQSKGDFIVTKVKLKGSGLYTRNIDSLSVRKVKEAIMPCLPLSRNPQKKKWEDSAEE